MDDNGTPITADRLFAKIGALVIENEVLREQNVQLKSQLALIETTEHAEALDHR